MQRSSSRKKKVSNTSLNKHLTEKDFGCNKLNKYNMGIAGATNEVAALKEAVSAAERSAAAERAEREKQEGGWRWFSKSSRLSAGYCTGTSDGSGA